ncbi:MAG: PAS domain S-box protein [Deltaproteobacteria bacterium]|nr:PAS domain S-box protein [Deltaproteobacteria bacterium]
MSASFKPRFSFSSLRVRSMLLVLLTAIPVVGLILYSFHEQRQMAKNEATENALYLVRFASQEEKLLLETTRHFLSGLAWLHEIRSGDPAKCSAFLANLLKQYPLYANLGVIKPDGTQYCSALPITEKVSPVDRRWFQEAIRSRGFSVGDYQFGRISRKPVLVLAYPVLDKKGRVMSILATALDLGWFNQVAAKARLPQGSSFSIMDRNGLVLARHPNPDKWIGKTLPERVLLQTVRARRGAGTVEGPDADGGRRLFAFAPLHGEQDGLYLTIGIPQQVAYASANQMLWRYLTVLGFACFLLMVLAWWGSHLLIIRPVRALLNATKLLATGNLSARVDAGNGEGELGQLATSINEMAASLEARQAEAEHAYKTAREKSRMLDLFFKYALTPVVFLDREFNFIRVNEAYARACRQNVSEFPGHNYFEFYPLDAKGMFEEVVKTKKPFQTLARSFVFPDHPEWGVTYWDWSLVPILDDAGEVELLVFSVNDVTKRKRAEEELSRTTQTLQALVHASPVGINILDTDGKVKLWNPAAERIFGWKEEEILGLPLPIIPEDKQEEFRKSYAAVLQGRHVTELETHRQRKDGSLVDVSISTGPIRDAGGSILGSMGVLTDITERKRLEKEIAEISEREKERIERDLHDGLGQELTGIAFLAKGLKEKLGRTSIPESADADKIAHLVTQAVSHTRSLARGLSPVPVGGNGLMSALEELTASVSTLFGVSCMFRCDQPVLVRDNTVATHLYRIAQEAVDNAIKHGKAKQISVQLSSQTSTAILSVTDNGTGFPEMADDNGGLGLRIMRHRAEMIQGSLEIRRRAKSRGTVVLCSFAFPEPWTEGDRDNTITKRG